MHKPPTSVVTRYPARPDCDCCKVTFGSENVVRVMYPTSNPKKVRSTYLCSSCWGLGCSPTHNTQEHS